MVLKDETLTSEITNERLMEESGWVFDKIKSILERALRDAELTVVDIGAVVMAGGSSNMPVVCTFLKILFPESDIIYGSGEELIARGVGLISSIIERKSDIKEVVMTTGYESEKLIDYGNILCSNLGMKVQFVFNDLFNKTNYIYSIYLAEKFLHDDILLLHGDLVFDLEVLQKLLQSDCSRMIVSSTTPLPQKVLTL